MWYRTVTEDSKIHIVYMLVQWLLTELVKLGPNHVNNKLQSQNFVFGSEIQKIHFNKWFYIIEGMEDR